MMITKLLAWEYRHKIRFAYSDIGPRGDEKLKETFEVYTVPQNFFCKQTQDREVMCYEMQSLSITYKEIKDFIDQKYLDESFLNIKEIEPSLNEGFGVY